MNGMVRQEMTTLRPLFCILLLLYLPLAPVFATPPIRCVHQATVIKDGKATTHLILTTARRGADSQEHGRCGSSCVWQTG